MEKHTMRDYVLQTPAILRRLLTEHWEAPLAAAFAARPVRILRLVASGSSYNAALCVRPYLRKWLSCEVLITEPFTFCTYECQQPEDELAVVISQSGYSTNALQALDAIHAKGRTAIGITSDPASDLRLHADLLIDYGCGPESVGYVTMGVTSLGLFLCLFALQAAYAAGRLSGAALAAEREKLFRLADAYEQAIPAGETTARNGRWEQGPRMELFRALHNALGSLPIVAEDLGEMFDSVRELLAESGFPGMKVLQFAFTGEDSVDLPHNYPRNCVAYPGTHDNNTLTGWFAKELTAAQRKQVVDYFALTKQEGTARGMLRGVLASTAALAIIPMADWLEEPAAARMNTPGQAQGNWQWRADAKKLTPALAAEIRVLTERYFRAAK